MIYTVIDKTRDLQPYIDAGVNIFNVSGGKDTVELVKWVREQYPDFPIIASGGKTDASIEATIDAGANAITNPRSQGCPRFQSGEELANSVGRINAYYSL